MKQVLLSALLLCNLGAFAQSSNREANLETQKASLVGYFEFENAPGQGTNVNYSFTPAKPQAYVNIMFYTPAPSPLSLKIKNHEGEVIKEWNPVKELSLYEDEIDLSKIKSGEYSYEVYWDNKLAQSIPFVKQ